MCNLIFFGAGASFGSDESSPLPALGRKLFDALSKFSPKAWGAVDDSFARQFRTDFEQGMKAFAEADPTNVDVLQRAMAAYFFEFKPASANLYVRLAQRIRDCNWSGALASLNYERLLELSLRDAGLCVRCAPPELYTDLELCLPHGCCHLFCNIRAGQGTANVPGVNLVAKGPTILKGPRRADGTEVSVNLTTQQGGAISFGPRLWLDGERPEVIEDPVRHAKELLNSTVPPVMSYFQPDKETRSGVSFIRGQRRRLAELVQAAQAVAIIGVTVRPHDTHIWNPLRESSARIIYCSGKQAADDFLSWSADAGRQHDDALPFDWREAFDDLCSRIGLA